MTLDDFYRRLFSINAQAQDLITDSGISGDGIPWDHVAIDEDDPDEVFQWESAVRLMGPFRRLHKELMYLHTPPDGEHALERYPGGHYGYTDSDGRDHILFCGNRVEALVTGHHGNLRWELSRIEHNGHDYFLYGHADIPLEGLTVRERRCAP